MTAIITGSTALPVTAEQAFAWHIRPGAFERLIPPWSHDRFLEHADPFVEGARQRIHMGAPLRHRWEQRVAQMEQGREFTTEQVRGPLAEWRHTRRFVPDGAGSRLDEELNYRLPWGVVGSSLAGPWVRRELQRRLRFRQHRISGDLIRHAQFAHHGSKRIVISGASGFIGRHLAAFLASGGHHVVRLVRGATQLGSDEINWNPAQGELDLQSLEGAYAVIHLAGAGIASGRWNRRRKASILESRVQGTALLAESLARLNQPPSVLISASATGFYGDCGDAPITEDSPGGSGFLAEVCQAWEAAAAPAADAGIRVVTPRMGMVLGAAGGALARLLIPFRLGLGGRVGSGRQVMSWVALDDLLGAILHILFTNNLSGALNLTAPHAVTNREFSRTLGAVLRRPAVAPLPAAVVRMMFGEMGQSLLLEGARILPQRLLGSGFSFRYSKLEDALRMEVGRD